MCANTGTIPSKTLREAAIYLTGLSERGLYGQSYRVKDEITIEDLIWRTQQVMAREIDVIRNQLARNHVRVLAGHGRFADPHHVEVADQHGNTRTLEADRIVIATGTAPAHPPDVEFDEATILDSDGILNLARDPRHAARRRRRRDRHRVRLDLRGPRHAGDRRRAQPPAARVLRRPDRSRRSSTTCAISGWCCAWARR